MRIAIYHNLRKGGALIQASKIIKSLTSNHEVKIFSTNKNISINGVKTKFYKTSNTRNILDHLIQAIFELKKIDKEISEDISKENYDLLIVFPCITRQSPHILRYFKNNIYIFAETKREFYEKTNFYFSVKKILTLIIRYPIKIIDQTNCRSAKTIICNSYYSKNVLKNIYKKKRYRNLPRINKLGTYKNKQH